MFESHLDLARLQYRAHNWIAAYRHAQLAYRAAYNATDRATALALINACRSLGV